MLNEAIPGNEIQEGLLRDKVILTTVLLSRSRCARRVFTCAQINHVSPSLLRPLDGTRGRLEKVIPRTRYAKPEFFGVIFEEALQQRTFATARGTGNHHRPEFLDWMDIGGGRLVQTEFGAESCREAYRHWKPL